MRVLATSQRELIVSEESIIFSDRLLHFKEAQMSSVSEQIMRRVKAKRRGEWVCSPKDFLDLGSRAAVDKALSRLTQSGTLRRVGRGLYDWPRIVPVLNDAAPAELTEIVAAVARRDSIEIMPDNLVAANSIGLTNAVPAKVTYLINGRTRTINAGGWSIELKHAPAQLMIWGKSPARPFVQAIYWLGRDRVGDTQALSILSRSAPPQVKSTLMRQKGRLPAWAQMAAAKITSQEFARTA